MRRVSPEAPEGETGDTLSHQCGDGNITRCPDSCILGRKIWKLRGHVQLVCVWGLHIPERQEQLVQVLREEHGSSSFQRDGEEVLPLPWSLLLPMPLQGCSRDSTVSHVRSPRGFGGYPTSPRTQTLRSAAMMFHDMTFTQFPGQGHTMSSFVSISRSSLCDAPWNQGQTSIL